MSIKQKFAKFSVDVADAPTEIKTVYVMLFGTVALFGSIPILENLPMDDTVKPGSEVAVQEYTNALDVLSEYRTEHKAGALNGVSKVLAHAAGNSEAEAKIPTPEMMAEFQQMGEDFGGSLIVDTRLSEQQKYDLVQAFESRIGEFEVYTGLQEPDYADLDESKSWVDPVRDEYAYAEQLIERSYRPNTLTGSLLSGAGVVFGMLMLYMFAGANREHLSNVAKNPNYKKPPKFPH